MTNFGVSNVPNTEKIVSFAAGVNTHVDVVENKSELRPQFPLLSRTSRLFFSSGSLTTILGNEGKGALRFVVGCL